MTEAVHLLHKKRLTKFKMIIIIITALRNITQHHLKLRQWKLSGYPGHPVWRPRSGHSCWMLKQVVHTHRPIYTGCPKKSL